MLNVQTIYPAFMGEVNKFGIGAPCVFVRLSKCPLRCYLKTKGILCDTPEALEGKSGHPMDEWDILESVDSYGYNLICLTGGEPLLQDVSEFLRIATLKGYHVAIETSGCVDILPYRHFRNVSFIVDYKLPSTGENLRMKYNNYHLLNEDDFVKVVVDDEADLENLKTFASSYLQYSKTNLAVGVFWGSAITYQALMQYMHTDEVLSSLGIKVYLNMQTHKMAVLYDKYKDEATKLVVPREL